MPYIGRSTEAFGVRSRFTFLASADDTSVSGNDVNGLPLSFTDGAYVDVFLNGVRLKHNTDYVTTTANTISSLAALAANDEIEVVVFDVFSLADMVSSANGGNFFNQVNFKTDSAVVAFGADNDVTLTHVADTGLKLKNTSTSGNSGIGAVLTLQTGDTDIAVNNILGSIQFQAPDEGTGTDAILVAGKMEVFSEGDFSSSNNATSMRFLTGRSAAAGTDGGSMILGSTGNLTLKDLRTTDGSSPRIALETGDTDIAQDDVLGDITFQAPDEGTGTDAILTAAAIAAVSEGDFSSSSNATKLSFKTAASEVATEKMSLSSAGLLTVSGRIITDDTTEATSTTDGSLQTDGGLSVAKDIVAGDDVKLLSDSAVLSFGADSDTTLTHTDGTGLTLNSTNKLTFGDAASFIQQSSNGVLRIDGEATIDLNASTEVNVSGLLTVGGRIVTDDTTDATSTTDGSLQTDGGLSVAKDAVIGNDLLMLSDSSAIKFGADSEMVLTHSADAGLTLLQSDAAGALLTLGTTSTSVSDDAFIGGIDFTSGSSSTVNARMHARQEGTSENGGKIEFETRREGGSLLKSAKIDDEGRFSVASDGLVGRNQIVSQFTVSCDTSANVIANTTRFRTYGTFFVVSGRDHNSSANRFVDILVASLNGSVVVVAGNTVRGSPASRSYSNTSERLNLTMGGGSYSVCVMAFDFNNSGNSLTDGAD